MPGTLRARGLPCRCAHAERPVCRGLLRIVDVERVRGARGQRCGRDSRTCRDSPFRCRGRSQPPTDGRCRADGKARGLVEGLDNRGEVFEPVPEARSLAGGLLEQDAERGPGQPLPQQASAVRRRASRSPPSSVPGGERARMHYEPVEAEHFGAINLLAEGGKRLRSQLRLGGGEIDQVAVVRDDRLNPCLLNPGRESVPPRRVAAAAPATAPPTS